MGNQGCSEWIAQETAVKLFQTAALLLGNEAEAVTLVEETIAGVEVDPCADAANALTLVQRQLLQAAIQKLSHREPGSFVVAGELSSGNSSCIEDDDIAASGISTEQLGYLLEGDGRQQLRTWLEHLPAAQRTIFVSRAMLGQDNASVASILKAGGGEGAAGWTPERVSDVYRQALCSLATSLIHSGTAAPVL